MEAQATLKGTARMVVLNAEAGESLERPTSLATNLDGDLDGHLAKRVNQQLLLCGFQAQPAEGPLQKVLLIVLAMAVGHGS